MENIDWAIKSGEDWKKKYGSKKRNTHTREARRLKYCNSCNVVWEINVTGSIRRYKHLPTYGLPRINCKICEKKPLIGNER